MRRPRHSPLGDEGRLREALDQVIFFHMAGSFSCASRHHSAACLKAYESCGWWLDMLPRGRADGSPNLMRAKHGRQAAAYPARADPHYGSVANGHPCHQQSHTQFEVSGRHRTSLQAEGVCVRAASFRVSPYPHPSLCKIACLVARSTTLRATGVRPSKQMSMRISSGCHVRPSERSGSVARTFWARVMI